MRTTRGIASQASAGAAALKDMGFYGARSGAAFNEAYRESGAYLMGWRMAGKDVPNPPSVEDKS